MCAARLGKILYRVLSAQIYPERRYHIMLCYVTHVRGVTCQHCTAPVGSNQIPLPWNQHHHSILLRRPEKLRRYRGQCTCKCHSCLESHSTYCTGMSFVVAGGAMCVINILQHMNYISKSDLIYSLVNKWHAQNVACSTCGQEPDPGVPDWTWRLGVGVYMNPHIISRIHGGRKQHTSMHRSRAFISGAPLTRGLSRDFMVMSRGLQSCAEYTP